jgi:hypothetical protein
LDVVVKKYIDEHARASHEHRNNLNNSNNNSIIENTSNNTIFGYTFSNMKVNAGLLEYKEKIKKCSII